MSERLQKLLARHGLGSRREIERWITEGRVLLNGKPAQLGDQYRAGDRIAVDGRDVTARLKAEAPAQVLIYHKPQGQPLVRGEEANVDDGFDSVQDHLPATRGTRWIAVNPMHPGDSGLLLFTNDGALDYALTRHKRWIPSAYMVRVLAPGNAESPPEISLQVDIDQEVVEFEKIEPAGGEGSNIWYRVEMSRADRRAAVRAAFESRGIKVNRMTQVAFGGIELPRDLPRMRHRALSGAQLTALYTLAKLSTPSAVAEVAASRQSPRRTKSSAHFRMRQSQPRKAKSKK